MTIKTLNLVFLFIPHSMRLATLVDRVLKIIVYISSNMNNDTLHDNPYWSSEFKFNSSNQLTFPSLSNLCHDYALKVIAHVTPARTQNKDYQLASETSCSNGSKTIRDLVFLTKPFETMNELEAYVSDNTVEILNKHFHGEAPKTEKGRSSHQKYASIQRKPLS